MLKKIFSAETNGYLLSNLITFAIIGANRYLIVDTHTNVRGTFVFSEFVIIPMLMGIIAAWFWRNLNLNGRALSAKSCINACIAIFLSSILLGEGSICLIIVSPLLLSFTIGGAFLGRAMFRRSNNKINVSIIGLLIAVFIIDSGSAHHYENKVSDTIIVNAPPGRVWKNVVAFKRIKEKNKFWLFKIGMPSPVESTVEGYYLGANRKCIFSNGYIFDEKL